MILLLNRGVGMAGFIEGVDRGQLSLLPESLDQWVEDSNPVRVIDAFVEQLDLDELGMSSQDQLTVKGSLQAPAGRQSLSSTTSPRSSAGTLCGTWSTVFGNDSFQSEAVIRGNGKGRLVPGLDISIFARVPMDIADRPALA